MERSSSSTTTRGQVDVDDEVADFMIKDGRAGVSLVEEPNERRRSRLSALRILFRVKEKELKLMSSPTGMVLPIVQPTAT